MSQTSPTPNQRLVTELKVSAHLMLLDPGVFCIFHAPGTPLPDPATRLPGVRVSRPPSVSAEAVQISTFSPDGWLGGESGAALVRVAGGQAQVLVSIYQSANSTQEAPKLQVLRLSEQPAPSQPVVPQAAETPNAPASKPEPASDDKPEVAAHVQRAGDLLTRIGEWMGTRGSQNWIEGFAIQPASRVDPADIEYQAVLGKGWLSPWAEGGKYCGSRGMALPILGLRVRLKGEAAEKYAVRIHATFIDGSEIGPVDGTQTAETESLAPLEAFKIELVPLEDEQTSQPKAAAAPAPAPAKAAKPGRPAKPTRPAPVAAAPARAASRPTQAGPQRAAKPSTRPQKPVKGSRSR
ncbi:hypothetical protein NFI95_06870 [Acetobacteraceae bacterium KSS8]|uniref:Hydrophobic W protein n=1 Tax=Endosaccharibacter trunci TaxID=2812733 RepID=A0ABT1W5Y6_9PROT|nr:hypothetical protein [Acetobacteraceae bacterium KSS8]